MSKILFWLLLLGPFFSLSALEEAKKTDKKAQFPPKDLNEILSKAEESDVLIYAGNGLWHHISKKKDEEKTKASALEKKEDGQ